MEPRTFIFAGPSGSGKGTQVQKLQQYFRKLDPDRGQFQLSTGAEFRAFHRDYPEENHTAELSRTITRQGGLQPPFLAIWAWAGRLVQDFTGEEHLFLDGSPRTVAEAHIIESAMEFYSRQPVEVIVVEVSRPESLRRLLERARGDDTESSIQHRLDWYEKQVKPALELYQDRPRFNLHWIDGEQDIEEVHRAITNSLAL